MKRWNRKRSVLWAVLPLTLAVVASCAPVPPPEGPAAQPASEPDSRSVLDGVFTAAQASRGQTSFQASCAACHSPGEFSGPGFQRMWANQTVGHIHRQISSTMPLDAPGSLSGATYTDIITFLLRQNGYPTGPQELATDSASLFGVRMEPVAAD